MIIVSLVLLCENLSVEIFMVLVFLLLKDFFFFFVEVVFYILKKKNVNI